MTVRRLAAADCQKVNTFLNAVAVADPPSHIAVEDKRDRLAAGVDGGALSWVCVEEGKIVGLLGPAGFGVREERTATARGSVGKLVTFVHFSVMVVDWVLYQTSKEEALRIANELTLAAADDIKAAGKEPDEIRVTGSAKSRGASYAREYLGFETVRQTGDAWEGRLDWPLIWERAKLR